MRDDEDGKWDDDRSLSSISFARHTCSFCFGVWGVSTSSSFHPQVPCQVWIRHSTSLLIAISKYCNTEESFSNNNLVSQCHTGTLSHGHCKYLGSVSRLQDCGTKRYFCGQWVSEFTYLPLQGSKHATKDVRSLARPTHQNRSTNRLIIHEPFMNHTCLSGLPPNDILRVF